MGEAQLPGVGAPGSLIATSLPDQARGSASTVRQRIVSVATAAAPSASRARIVAALHRGRLRASWHVYNTDADVDTALAGADRALRALRAGLTIAWNATAQRSRGGCRLERSGSRLR